MFQENGHLDPTTEGEGQKKKGGRNCLPYMIIKEKTGKQESIHNNRRSPIPHPQLRSNFKGNRFRINRRLLQNSATNEEGGTKTWSNGSNWSNNRRRIYYDTNKVQRQGRNQCNNRTKSQEVLQ